MKKTTELIKVTDGNSIDTVVSLADRIWRSHYTPIIGENAVEYMLNKFQSAAAIQKQIEEDNCQYYLISENLHPIGYIAVWFRQDEVYLSKFYVLDSERGKGHGRKAMEFIEDLALKKHLRKLSLNVNKRNLSSIRIYENLGFTVTGEVVIDIESGYVMDDYKMEKILV